MAARSGAAEGLRKGIAEFYDESSGVWESIWGDHMHHGFYEPGATASIADHRAAQIRMVEEALRFAGVSGRSPPQPPPPPSSLIFPSFLTSVSYYLVQPATRFFFLLHKINLRR